MNRLIATLLPLLFAHITFAQDWFYIHEKNNKLDGYIIGIAGDTIRGFIQFDYPILMQKRVLFFDSSQDQNPRLYEPDDIRGYSAAAKRWASARIIMYTYDGFFTFNRFGIVESIPGPLVLLRIFDEPDKFKKKLNSQEAEVMYHSIPLNRKPISIKNLYIKKNEESAMSIFSKDFKNSFVEKIRPFVGEHKELMSKIENKEWRVHDIEHVINEYNRWYKSKYKE